MTSKTPSKRGAVQGGGDQTQRPVGAGRGKVGDAPPDDPPEDEDPELGESYAAINTTRSNIKNTFPPGR